MLQVDSKVIQLYAYLCILFSDSFPLCSSLCYTTGPCCLSLLSVVACIFIPNSSVIPFPLNFLFCISEPLLFSFQHFFVFSGLPERSHCPGFSFPWRVDKPLSHLGPLTCTLNCTVSAVISATEVTTVWPRLAPSHWSFPGHPGRFHCQAPPLELLFVLFSFKVSYYQCPFTVEKLWSTALL